MNDDLNLSMFRAYDIRTPASRLSRDLVERLARAEGAYFREMGAEGVVVARDARLTGPAQLSVLVDAFRGSGLDVLYVPGACSTSMFYHVAMCHPGFGGVIVGASHNPADHTGQKLVAPGVRPIARAIGPSGGLDRLSDLYRQGVAVRSTRPGSVRSYEPLDRYVAYGMELAGVAPGGLRGLRLMQDYLHGSAGREMLHAFGRAGADLLPLHFVPDGHFPLGDPNPVKSEVIEPGLSALREGGFLLGMFLDGDGDRLDVYRGDGSYLASSFVYAAILPEILARGDVSGRGVFADLKSSPLAVIEMARTGLGVDVIRNGHSQIKESLARDTGRLGAVEESAHFYEAFSMDGERYCTENTLYVALLIARVWSEDPERFDRLIELQRTTAREREWGYKFPSDAARGDALAAVRQRLEANGFQSLDRMRNGMDLEATLLRRGLPLDVGPRSVLSDDWAQVCQRVSQSEDGLARWEVVSGSAGIARELKEEIARVARAFGAGPEYQG